MPSISISSDRGPLNALMHRSSEWTGMPEHSPAAVYLSSGNDSRMLAVTHPEHLRAKAGDGPAPEPFSFYVHVDKQTSVNLPELDFRDANTVVEEEGRELVRVDRHEAILLMLKLRSDRYSERKLAVLRIRATNDCLITVCDGCALGGNRRCENDIGGKRRTNLLRLRPDWLVTDHLKYGNVGTWLVPREGEYIEPRNMTRFDLRFRHVAQLTTPKRPMLFDDNRDRHVHLYDVQPTKYRPPERPGRRPIDVTGKTASGEDLEFLTAGEWGERIEPR